jgi:citrate synthase
MMGRLSFGEAIYLLLQGELPSPAIGRLMEALLVSFIDHGATPPSTLASRNTATTGAPLRACVAAGVLGFGRYFGGDITACMQLLDEGLALCRGGMPIRDAAAQVLGRYLASGETPPGFGHRFHSRDPRATRLFQMAMELELDGEHIRFIRALEFELQRAHEGQAETAGKTPPVNIDGAIAAVCGDLGLKPDVADALFVISRVPGIAAHALEERERNPPMRQIDPKDHVYDGPSERRLPETRRR